MKKVKIVSSNDINLMWAFDDGFETQTKAWNDYLSSYYCLSISPKMINFTFSFVFALHLFCHTKDIYFIVCVCGRERETEREKQKYLSLFPIFLSLCLPTISGPLSLSLCDGHYMWQHFSNVLLPLSLSKKLTLTFAPLSDTWIEAPPKRDDKMKNNVFWKAALHFYGAVTWDLFGEWHVPLL